MARLSRPSGGAWLPKGAGSVARNPSAQTVERGTGCLSSPHWVQTVFMTRNVRVGAGQLGPIQRDDSRDDVVMRLLDLLREAADAGCDLLVYPELALTTFFPRWFVDDITTADHWYERSMPNAATQPLFDEARRLGVGFCLGYALLDDGADGIHRWNVQTLVERDGSVVATFKKVHIP